MNKIDLIHFAAWIADTTYTGVTHLTETILDTLIPTGKRIAVFLMVSPLLAVIAFDLTSEKLGTLLGKPTYLDKAIARKRIADLSDKGGR